MSGASDWFMCLSCSSICDPGLHLVSSLFLTCLRMCSNPSTLLCTCVCMSSMPGQLPSLSDSVSACPIALLLGGSSNFGFVGSILIRFVSCATPCTSLCKFGVPAQLPSARMSCYNNSHPPHQRCMLWPLVSPRLVQVLDSLDPSGRKSGRCRRLAYICFRHLPHTCVPRIQELMAIVIIWLGSLYGIPAFCSLPLFVLKDW